MFLNLNFGCFFFSALFDVENFGKGMVALRSSKSRRYIAMNSKGKLYSKVRKHLMLHMILLRY